MHTEILVNRMFYFVHRVKELAAEVQVEHDVLNLGSILRIALQGIH